MNTSRYTTRRLALAALVLTICACGGEPVVSETSDTSALPSDQRTIYERFEGRCDSDLTGEVPATSGRALELGISTFSYTLRGQGSGSTLEVEARDAQGATLGALVVTPTLGEGEELESPGALEMRWSVPGEDVFSLDASLAPTFDRGLLYRVEVARGEESYEVEANFSEDISIRSVRVSVQGDGSREPELGESLSRLGGGVTHTLEVYPDGAPVDAAAFSAWSDQSGMPDWSDSPSLDLLNATFGDTSWSVEVYTHVTACGQLAGLDYLTREGALGAGEQCSGWDIIWQNGGIGVVGGGAVLVVMAFAAGGIAAVPFVASAAVIGGIAVSLTTILYVYTKKRCYATSCQAACRSAGSKGGGCTGRTSCSCGDDFPDAKNTGDPHTLSFDGLYYDFQGVGEYTLARATSGDLFEVQVRQSPINDPNCSGTSVQTAFATRVGPHTVGLYARGSQVVLEIDGDPVGLPTGRLELSGGVIERDMEGDWFISLAGGEMMSVAPRGTYLNVSMDLPDSRLGQVAGTLGTFDGDPGNEFVTRDGQPLDPAGADIYGAWQESWRVGSTSLFTYPAGEDTEDYTQRDFGFVTDTSHFTDAARAEAYTACEAAGVTDPVLREGCALDYACLGPGSVGDFAELAELAEERGVGAVAGPPVSIVFDDWTVEGDPANGNWEVSADGRGVTQTLNNDPTFFVSGQTYRGVTLSGTWSIGSVSDDDIIGFVMGYDAPLSSEGDDPGTHDTLLFDWKAFGQSSDGYRAEEGYTLSRLDGTPAGGYVPTFWGHDDPSIRVLASDHGSGKGWREERDYRFVLSYSSTLLRIFIDGGLVFDLSASDVGMTEFPLGRFGFYNYSQSDVSYERFESLPYLLDPVFHDDFEQESNGIDYDAFARWEVAQGFVDVVTVGPTSRLVDLDGSQRDGGTMRTRDAISLSPGTYRLTFDLKPPSVGDETVRVALGGAYSEDISLVADDAADALIVERTIVVEAAEAAFLSFSTDSEDGFGAHLDNVALYRVR